MCVFSLLTCFPTIDLFSQQCWLISTIYWRRAMQKVQPFVVVVLPWAFSFVFVFIVDPFPARSICHCNVIQHHHISRSWSNGRFREQRTWPQLRTSKHGLPGEKPNWKFQHLRYKLWESQPWLSFVRPVWKLLQSRFGGWPFVQSRIWRTELDQTASVRRCWFRLHESIRRFSTSHCFASNYLWNTHAAQCHDRIARSCLRRNAIRKYVSCTLRLLITTTECRLFSAWLFLDSDIRMKDFCYFVSRFYDERLLK